MKLNTSKSKSCCFSRSHTLLPPHGDLCLDGSVLTSCDELKILGVMFDQKLTFEHHIRSLVNSASRKLGLMRKAYTIFNDVSISGRCFNCFVLPHLEYCAPVWSSAAASHIRLVDKVLNTGQFLCDGNPLCDLGHRRNVGKVCMLYKIRSNPSHPLHSCVPGQYVPARNTGLASSLHSFTLQAVKCHTSQFQRCFLPSAVRLWNSLDGDTCAAGSVHTFKSKANKYLRSI